MLQQPERHVKKWGEEVWIVNAEYCGKLLKLKQQHRCSYHVHRKKDEVFYVSKGKVLLELRDKHILMKPGDSMRIPPGTGHRFLGLEDSEIIEFSTHHEEEDSYRHPEKLSGKVSAQEFALLLGSFT